MTRATTFRAAAVFGGFLLAILMVMSASRALFTNPTSNDANAWTSGNVVLVNEAATTDGGPGPADYDESGTALFTITAMAPGDSDTVCFEVIYEGNLDALIELDSVMLAGVDENTISAEMNLTIDRYDVAGCDPGDFDADVTNDAGSPTLAAPDLVEVAWSPAVPGTDESRWYQITVELDSGATNDMQDRTVDDVEFEWLATSN
jgi:hypothetical protein